MFCYSKQMNIHQACARNRIFTLKRLIRNGVDINARDADGKTPLMICCKMNSIWCLKILLAQPGIDVNALDEDKNTALIIACSYDHHKCVKCLMKYPGVLLNHINKYGDRALMVAFFSQRGKSLKLLCENQEVLHFNPYNSGSLKFHTIAVD